MIVVFDVDAYAKQRCEFIEVLKLEVTLGYLVFSGIDYRFGTSSLV